MLSPLSSLIGGWKQKYFAPRVAWRFAIAPRRRAVHLELQADIHIAGICILCAPSSFPSFFIPYLPPLVFFSFFLPLFRLFSLALLVHSRSHQTDCREKFSNKRCLCWLSPADLNPERWGPRLRGWVAARNNKFPVYIIRDVTYRKSNGFVRFNGFLFIFHKRKSIYVYVVYIFVRDAATIIAYNTRFIISLTAIFRKIIIARNYGVNNINSRLFFFHIFR